MYRPKKQLGQNFLSDKDALMKIVDAGNITKEDVVLEIGPGQGSMTYHLAQRAKKVIAIEKDAELVNYLQDKFSTLKNLYVVNADILEYLSGLEINKLKGYKVVGNIPYYLTSHLIRQLLALKNKPLEIILMVQKEVAERMVAKPGDMNLLAISVQIFADPEMLFIVSKNSFWPKPKVDSAVIKLKVYKVIKHKVDEGEFFNLVKAGFGAKRKILVNNLVKGLDIEKEKIYDIFKELGISVNSRAQDLGVEDWVNILKLYEKQKEK